MSDAMQKPIISLLTFSYKKGDDKPTEERNLFVTESGPSFVRGICADKKQWRSFSRNKMSEVERTPWRTLGWTAEYVVDTILKPK
jgi:hypothetical protein